MHFLTKNVKISKFARRFADQSAEKITDRTDALTTFENCLATHPTQSREKNLKIFKAAIDFYLHKQGTLRRGHVEFINGALDNMKNFGIEEDLDSYANLLEVFPKGVMVAESAWQREFVHFPKQQYCCDRLLNIMEANGVVPNEEMGVVISSIFGVKSLAMRRYLRTMYWLPKFKGMNPYPVPPFPLGISDPIEMGLVRARMALKRMSFDIEAVISCRKLETEVTPAYIVSSQCPKQKELLLEAPQNSEFYISGPFRCYLRKHVLEHYILRCRIPKIEADLTADFMSFYFENEEDRKKLIPAMSVHEQEEGAILALCIVVGKGGDITKSLHAWLKFLQEDNQSLISRQVNIRLAEEPI